MHREAAREALGIKYFEQTRERVGVAVVRRRRQEEAVLETRGQSAHGAGELAIDRITYAAGRRRMVRLVKDEERARPEVGQHVPETAHIGLVDQQRVRDDEPRAGRPRIGGVAALAPEGG